MRKINKSSTLSLIGMEGYSTPVGSETGETLHGANVFRAKAEEAVQRSPTGSFAQHENEAVAIKRVAWTGNYPLMRHDIP